MPQAEEGAVTFQQSTTRHQQMANDATRGDLVNDCRESFKVIAEEIGFGNFTPQWLEKLNWDQLDGLSSFLDAVWSEVRQP
jgi:hypothetical protein